MFLPLLSFLVRLLRQDHYCFHRQILAHQLVLTLPTAAVIDDLQMRVLQPPHHQLCASLLARYNCLHNYPDMYARCFSNSVLQKPGGFLLAVERQYRWTAGTYLFCLLINISIFK